MIAQRNKPVCRRQDALAVAARLRESGHIAYFAGGCVRDLLLGLEPADYDIATDALPDRVRKLFPQTQAVGAAFGVILVRHGKSVVEVATFRADGDYSDGRHPDSVRFAAAEEDARRRDFTINGLFLDPSDDQVIDHVGGKQDLAEKRLRAIGDAGQRFAEDQLRLLRGVRFAARFDLEIDPPTADAMRQAASRLKGISPERIGEELRLMLTPITRRKAWPMLWEYELAPVIFRLFAPSPGTPGEGWGEGLRRELFLALSPNNPISFPLALAAIILEITNQSQLERQQIFDSAHKLRTLLRTSNEEFDAFEQILGSLPPLLGAQAPTVAMKKRFLATPTSADCRKLLAALAAVGESAQRIQSLEAESQELERTDFAPPPLLTGDDLVAAGLKPGPKFKQLLDSIYDAQLEGRISTKDEAMREIGQ